jgi:AcrR family transcriptional regulator
MNRQSPESSQGGNDQTGKGTKERILDTAEKLFARSGYRATSLRTLTAEAGVNLAAVNYHFGSKESLLDAVFERRLQPLNRVRLEKLDDVERLARRAGRPPRVREVLGAAIIPVVDARESSRGMRNFITLVGRSMAESDATARDLFSRHMKTVLARSFDLLREALPEIPREVVFWRLLLSFAATSRILCLPSDIPFLPEGVDLPVDRESMLSLLMPFITGGMEADHE